MRGQARRKIEHKHGLLVGFALLVVVTGPLKIKAEAEEEPPPRVDCGELALGALLHLEGYPTRLDDLATHLPPPGPKGHSMAQLREAARAMGLKLVGVRLADDPGTLDRPALVYLDRGEHGHFLVIRPVGHSGTLVQVLDSSTLPEVMEVSAFFRTPGWTGQALVPIRVNWARRLRLVGMGAGVIAGFLVVDRLRSRRRRLPLSESASGAGNSLVPPGTSP